MGFLDAGQEKLFANTYLALHMSCLNELDIYTEMRGINIKHLQTNCADMLGNRIEATVKSNCTRKDFIAARVLLLVEYYESFNERTCKKEKEKECVIGVYRLNMESSFANFCQSSIKEVMKRIKAKRMTVTVYEPKVEEKSTFLEIK